MTRVTKWPTKSVLTSIWSALRKSTTVCERFSRWRRERPSWVNRRRRGLGDAGCCKNKTLRTWNMMYIVYWKNDANKVWTINSEGRAEWRSVPNKKTLSVGNRGTSAGRQDVCQLWHNLMQIEGQLLTPRCKKRTRKQESCTCISCEITPPRGLWKFLGRHWRSWNDKLSILLSNFYTALSKGVCGLVHGQLLNPEHLRRNCSISSVW